MNKSFLDRMMEYLAGSFEKNYHAEQKECLLKRILFDGRKVDKVTYDYAKELYDCAKVRYSVGDKINARTFLYHAAKNMRLIK